MSREADSDDSLTWARKVGPGVLAERMGIEFVELSIERVVATMPVVGNTQPFGLMHGGAYVVLGESLGSVAAALHAGPERLVVGVDVNATHTRGVASGRHLHTHSPRQINGGARDRRDR